MAPHVASHHSGCLMSALCWLLPPPPARTVSSRRRATTTATTTMPCPPRSRPRRLRSAGRGAAGATRGRRRRAHLTSRRGRARNVVGSHPSLPSGDSKLQHAQRASILDVCSPSRSSSLTYSSCLVLVGSKLHLPSSPGRSGILNHHVWRRGSFVSSFAFWFSVDSDAEEADIF